MIPGEYILKEEEIVINAGRDTVRLVVTNTADRPVQVGSHIHFFEINRQMLFDREKAFGMRLNIAAGTAVRFEPGEEKEVELVHLGGARVVIGINNLTNGDTNDPAVKQHALNELELRNFKNRQP
ncbi:MAG TPA: urease subunit beta [Flavitalea sp.]|nr:urease subunit beta [Flavitalea sp.]